MVTALVAVLFFVASIVGSLGYLAIVASFVYLIAVMTIAMLR